MSIFIGGTGSSNELHDYEEGTWVPSIDGSCNNHYGKYVKIGRLVFVNFEISGVIPNANGSQFQIRNLPFTVNSNSHGFGNFGYVGNGTPAAVQLMPLANTNATFLYFHRQDGTSTPWTNNQHRSNMYNQNIILGHMYETDA